MMLRESELKVRVSGSFPVFEYCFRSPEISDYSSLELVHTYVHAFTYIKDQSS
jgi:hypothetical protein